MDSKLLRTGLAELVGTFCLVFIGCAAVASGQGVVVAALAHGLTLLWVIYSLGHISGAHVNPAVTLGLLIGGHIDLVKSIVYWVAQFAGGIIAALVLRVILGGGAPLGETTGTLTTDATMGSAILFEGVMTFFLVTAVYQCAAFGKAGQFAGLAIGLTLAAAILAGGTYTGASLNPSRTLGPALIAGNLSYVIPYLIGIFGGAIVAALINRFVLRGAR